MVITKNVALLSNPRGKGGNVEPSHWDLFLSVWSTFKHSIQKFLLQFLKQICDVFESASREEVYSFMPFTCPIISLQPPN